MERLSSYVTEIKPVNFNLSITFLAELEVKLG
jgi:hypothetical protein